MLTDSAISWSAWRRIAWIWSLSALSFSVIRCAVATASLWLTTPFGAAARASSADPSSARSWLIAVLLPGVPNSVWVRSRKPFCAWFPVRTEI